MTSVVSEFYGMTILMSLDPLMTSPYFSVLYDGQISRFDISSCRMIDGNLDEDGKEIIKDWWSQHQKLLQDNWDLLLQNKPLKKIEPIE